MSEEQELVSYEEALNAIEALHPAPQILAKASKLIQDPNTEVADIVELIRTDASLTTDIIRISNSAFYGFETEATNLQDAISRIGFSEVTRLIGIGISKSLFSEDLTHYRTKHSDYWAECVSTALVMEELAKLTNSAHQDAYTVGLLHGVGKIILNRIMNDFELADEWDGEQPVDVWERDVIGFTFAYAGAMILKRWEFPPKICHPILYQLNEPKEETQWSMHSLLYFASRLIELTGSDFGDGDCEIDSLTSLMEMLEIDPADLRALIERCRQAFLGIRHTLGIE